MSRKFSIDLDSDEDDECLVHSDDDQHHSDNEYQRILSDLMQQNTRSYSGEKKAKKPREPKAKKAVFPLPFISELIDISGCQGLSYNRGLFTQCSKKCMENGQFCSGCQGEADKNASGIPDCGTVDQRLAQGLYDFKDAKGRSPVSYVKVLEKLKLTKSQAEMAAGECNVEIPNTHFMILEKSKKGTVARGRPKKTGAIEADNVTDLFAKLTTEGEEEIIEDDEEKPVKSSKKSKLSEEEKAAKKAQLEEERALKRLEREAKLAQEKAEREEKRKADLEQKKQERELKLVQEKAEREAKRAQEKLEREQKKAADKALAGQKKESKKKAPEVTAPVVEATEESKVAAPAPSKVSVTRIQIGGKAYLKSSNNILYDPSTKEEIGLWDPISKSIKDLPDEDDEEEEEGYESD
jgi:chemotaxis protein histidine kinase CheA